MKASQVFTPGSFPIHTFVDDHLIKRRQILMDTLETDQGISISGPSKSGKTVFVQEAVGKDNLIHVTGAGVTSAQMLWMRVFDLIGTEIPQSRSEEKNFAATLGGKIGSGIDALIMKGSGEVSTSGTWSNKASESALQAVDLLQLLIKDLSGTSYILFIDDYHYIAREAQVEVARQIKEAIQKGVRIICASVPYHSDDAVRGNPDLRGRIVGIDFDYWDEPALSKIAEKGFNLLNIDCTPDFRRKVIPEVAGSPQLMQSICLNTCFESGFRERGPSRPVPSDDTFLWHVFARTALNSDYSSTLSRMIEGPKIRGEPRKQYLLSDGSQKDVYPLLIEAISQDPPTLTIRYPDLTSRVSGIVQKGADQPSGSSVTGACRHMSEIANMSVGHTVIEWDAENDVLDIQDPYLLFYLRWRDD